MDYEVYPLAITHVEWSIFIDVCQRVTGESPTRGLDASHLNIKDPAAFLGSFDAENKPVEALRDPYNVGHRHFSISFIMVLDAEGVIALHGTGLSLYTKAGQRRQTLVIATGSMDQWHRAVINGCREAASYELRWIMNQVVARFEQAGFREVFSHLKKQQQRDSTFILRS
jgi:hypothetical protein